MSIRFCKKYTTKLFNTDGYTLAFILVGRKEFIMHIFNPPARASPFSFNVYQNNNSNKKEVKEKMTKASQNEQNPISTIDLYRDRIVENEQNPRNHFFP